MDRHVKWLRRRIIASVAIQTAETFALVAVLAFAVMQWRTDEGPLTVLLGSVVVAQLVAGARIGHAMRNNPLNYVFMRRYIDQPFTYQVTRFQGEEEAHPVAELLPGFAPVATIRDHDAAPEPVFDVYHDPSRLVAASVSRASGSVSLTSSLADGRILVTDARSMPPHERLVMNLAADDSVDSVIATHRRAISARSDIVELASSAHQVVLDSLAVEYHSYLALGATLSPFLDLEPAGKSWLRLVARIKPAELSELPVRLGTDLSMPNVRVSTPATAPDPAANPVAGPTAPRAHPTVPTELNVPQVIAAHIAAPQMVAAEIVAPTVAELMPAVANVLIAATPVDGVPVVVVPTRAEPEAPAPVVEIAPHAFVTVEPDAADVATEGEPITAEVAAIVFTQGAASTEASGFVTPQVQITEAPGAALTQASAAEAPLDLAAAIASMATVPTIDVVAAPVPLVAPELVVAEPAPPPPAPVVDEPAVAEPAVAELIPFTFVAPELVHAPLSDFVMRPPAASLAEAVAPAPDTAAALTETGAPWSAPAEHVSDVDPVLVPNLNAALGRTEELSPTRPRLSAVLRANSGQDGNGSGGKRSRCKSR